VAAEQTVEDLIIVPMADSHSITTISQIVHRQEDYSKGKLQGQAMSSAIGMAMFFSVIKEIINGSKDNRISNGRPFKEMTTQ
jgi:hypothetical protein